MYSPGTLIGKGGLLLWKDPSCWFGLCLRAILNFGEAVANCVGHLDLFTWDLRCVAQSVFGGGNSFKETLFGDVRRSSIWQLMMFLIFR